MALSESTPTLGACLMLDELGDVIDETRLEASAREEPLSPDVAAIMYTSGTTGEPKGALMSHALGEASSQALAELLGPSADAASGLVVPIPHAFGIACLLASIAGGGLAVLVDSTMSLQPLVQAMRVHGGRVLHGTPALWASLLRGGVELPVQTGFTAGSACPPELLAALDQRGTRILNLYGMTEIGAATACRADDPAEVRYRTVGRALPEYEFRIVPESGAASPEPGEIQVRGPFVSPGYHRRPWTSEETAGEGWFRTGDLGSLDAAGNLVIAGRAKEVVHVGGFNVFPAEVENFLLTHPDIAQAAVIGVPHAALGEAMEAFVVPSPGARLEPGDVVRFARGGIAGYKVPYAVRVVAELPLLPSGKPDRRALAEAAERQRAVA
jgi:fatty-acyl-CoA synthase